jgi:hypothetical protein
MAGTPQKRARREQLAAAAKHVLGVNPAELVEPTNVRPLSPAMDAQRLGVAPTQAPARAGAREARALQPGRMQHQAVDAEAVAQMADFASVLSPECVVRVERLRPSFAAGIVEDVMLDSGELAELIEHVREEHGGQRYKLTLLSANGTALSTSKLNIPGAPRAEGRVRRRGYWVDGDERKENATAQQVVASPNDAFASLSSVVTALAEAMRPPPQQNVGMDIIGAVREIAKSNSEQVGGLVRALASTTAHRGGGITEQLGEVLNMHRAIGKLREAISDDAPPPRDDEPRESEGLFQGALKQAVGSIVAQGLANTMGAQAAQQPGHMVHQPRPMPQQPRPLNVRRVGVMRKAE